MHKIYGILLGDRDVPASQLLPDVPGLGETIRSSYFMWCIKDGDTAILVDTGLKGSDIAKRNMYNLRSPATQLEKLGVDPETIVTIIITHLHSDHFSAYELYPRATFLVQRREVEFFTGARLQISSDNEGGFRHARGGPACVRGPHQILGRRSRRCARHRRVVL